MNGGKIYCQDTEGDILRCSSLVVTVFKQPCEGVILEG